MDEMVAWLRGALDETEAIAAAASRSDETTWTVPAPGTGAAVESGDYTPVVYDEGKPTEEQSAHIALHDPRAVLARVQAERAIVMLWEKDWDGEIASRLEAELGVRHSIIEQLAVGSARSVLAPTLKALAYGHRFDAPGYREEWAPESVVTGSARTPPS